MHFVLDFCNNEKIVLSTNVKLTTSRLRAACRCDKTQDQLSLKQDSLKLMTALYSLYSVDSLL